MKRIIKVFILLFIILYAPSVNANSISSIEMEINIDKNGNATVKETWDAYLTSGTEGYKPYYNLGNSEIKDFTVTMGSTNYTSLNSWDTSGTLSSKAYKNGINEISDGVELCFGISSYGRHTYILNYTITNFVHELNDSELVYFTLMPNNFSVKPDRVYIKIYSPFRYSDSLDVWGYGYVGEAYVYDGYIEMSTDNGLDSSEYMVVLIKFPTGTFNNLTKLDNDFNYYYEMAEEGAISNDNSDDNDSGSIFITFVSLLFIFGIFAISLSKASKNDSNQKYKLNFESKGKKLKDVPNFRDIPCNKDVFLAYYLSYNYNLMKKQTDVFGAILLKWVKEKKISIIKKEKTGIFSKEENNIDLTLKPDFNDSLEKDLFNMLYSASKDGILESNEFESWCQINYKQILNWFTNVLDSTASSLIINKELTQVEKGTIFKHNEYLVSDNLREEAIKLKGLKNFLKEFTNIKNREAIEVNLFNEYLIFASIFGIADKVAKQFKKLYPDVVENLDIDYNSVTFINLFSSSSVSAASTAKARAEAYKSGGGGFSSSGGGGGSFGGGGGGGGFR